MGPMPQVFTPKEPGSQRARILAYGDSLIAGFRQHGLRFTLYAQALTDELTPQIDADIVMCGLSSVTAQQLASNVGARHVYNGCGRVGQGLGHIFKEQGPFDLVIIMAGTNDLGGSTHPEAFTQDVLALHVTCHRAGVRTVILSVHPNSGTNREVPRCHLYASRWESLNLRLDQKCCSDDGNAAFVDTSKIVPFGDLFEPDGLHFNEKGSRRLGMSIGPLILPVFQMLARWGQYRSVSLLPHFQRKRCWLTVTA